jgi:hypothetical protein
MTADCADARPANAKHRNIAANVNLAPFVTMDDLPLLSGEGHSRRVPALTAAASRETALIIRQYTLPPATPAQILDNQFASF